MRTTPPTHTANPSPNPNPNPSPNPNQVMAVDESLMCSFRILKPAEKQKSFGFGSRPLTPPRKR